MPNAFSLPTSALGGSGLQAEIRSHTESDGEASSILRSLERMGMDPSIKYYQMTPSKARRWSTASGIVWNVRAVRS